MQLLLGGLQKGTIQLPSGLLSWNLHLMRSQQDLYEHVSLKSTLLEHHSQSIF